MADGRVPLARQRPFENRCRGGERLEVAVGEEWRSFVHATIVAAPSDTPRQSAPVTPASRRREPETTSRQLSPTLRERAPTLRTGPPAARGRPSTLASSRR